MPRYTCDLSLRFRFLSAVVLALAVFLTAPGAALAALVYIDAGHGGPYRAGSLNGITEKDANLWIGLQLSDRLRAYGYRVGMTRTTDTAVELGDIPTWNWNSTYSGWDFAKDGRTGGDPPKDDLQARVNKANQAGADVFVSIHNNAGGGTGTETYCSRGNPLEQQLATYIQDAVVKEVGTYDRGAFLKDFYVIRWTNMPAVLVECAFYDNASDAALLKSDWWRGRFATGIAKGVRRFLDTKPFTQVYPRLSGNDRFATAAAISRAGWSSATSGTVILAAGYSWPDALTAAPLSRKLDAPLLLAKGGTVTGATAAEIARLKPRRIVVLGGRSAVPSSAVDAALDAAGPSASARRIAGANRYETASRVASEVGLPSDGRVVVVSGEKSPDALTASAFAGLYRTPILLSKAETVPVATASFLESNSATVKSTVVVGGTSVLPEGIVSCFPKRTRISGSDRYATNLAMMRTFWRSGSLGMYIANGESFADALAVAPWAAKNGRPLVLMKGKSMTPYQRQFIENNSSRIVNFTLIGGPAAMPYLVDWELRKAYK